VPPPPSANSIFFHFLFPTYHHVFIGFWNFTFPLSLFPSITFCLWKSNLLRVHLPLSFLFYSPLLCSQAPRPPRPHKVLYQNSAPFFHMSSDQRCDNPVARVTIFIHVPSSGRQLDASGLIIVMYHCLYIRTCWINTEVNIFFFFCF